ncbi:MAG: LptF/LptG family permease, partial [Armatimonadetes bacterium]|nr:LptF/LptG family permease [Armatimonadota bacterium]
WNKLALPLAALVFGLVGAPLGIRNHRAGTATGFALSVVIIFGYMMLANAMSIMAQGGRMPAFIASFTPIVIGLVVAMVLIQRRNR